MIPLEIDVPEVSFCEKGGRLSGVTLIKKNLMPQRRQFWSVTFTASLLERQFCDKCILQEKGCHIFWGYNHDSSFKGRNADLDQYA